MQRTNIYLSDEQVLALDALASQDGVARAEVVRRLIDRGLGRLPDDSTADLRAIEESFGSVADAASSARAPDDRAAHLEQTWRQ